MPQGDIIFGSLERGVCRASPWRTCQAKHDRHDVIMLLKVETNSHGDERVVVLPFGSVCSFFTSDASGEGIQLHVAPGALAIASSEHEQAAVREAVIVEVASRLQVSPEELLRQPLAMLKGVSDRSLFDDDPWQRVRRDRRGRPGLRLRS